MSTSTTRTSTGFTPPRKLATSSGFPTVAERPILCRGPVTHRSSRSRPNVSWAPLLDAARSWISSTTTHLTLSRFPLMLFVGRMAWSVSGVVMRSLGGLAICLLLSLWEVSPCLTWTGIPRCSDQNMRRLWMSLLRALRGVT